MLNGWRFTRIPSAGDARPDVSGGLTLPWPYAWFGKWDEKDSARPCLITSGNYGACRGVFKGKTTDMRINRDVTVMVKVEVPVAA